MRIAEIPVFKYAELSEDAQAHARDKWREHGMGYEWWDYIEDDMRHIADLFGFDVDNAYFSGFWSQGDGACITGTYSYMPGCLKAVKAYASTDEKLHGIVESLCEIQRRCFYSATSKSEHRGHYCHSGCMHVSTDVEYGDLYEAETGVEQALREFADWYYRRLSDEYEYLTSDETIGQTIRDNGHEFTADGERFE